MDDDFDQGAGQTAFSYTFDFLVAAKSAIDHVFGEGYAERNPMLVGACVQASAANLNAFMTAANSLPDLADDDTMMAMDQFLNNLEEMAKEAPSGSAKKSTKKRAQKAKKSS
ncbi:MAG: hypothetical protein AAFW83_04870 [Pseudomonadota bacterium]